MWACTLNMAQILFLTTSHESQYQNYYSSILDITCVAENKQWNHRQEVLTISTYTQCE